ncbi:dipeptidylpeptidase [Coemansia sp. RSA 552]|nr:dipeptidylpeptidase [Coemansia sp. RSA 552]
MRCWGLPRQPSSLALAAVAVIGVVAAETTVDPQPLNIKTFHSLNRVGTPVVSPDQTLALFTTSHYDQTENKSASYLSCLDIASGNITQLTENRPGTAVSNPMWYDAHTVGFLRKGALYKQDLNSTAASLVYEPPVPISNVACRMDKGFISFVASAYPGVSLQQCAEMKRLSLRKSDSAMVFDNLWARHWNEWMTMEKPSVFTASLTRSTTEGWDVGGETSMAAMLPQSPDPLVRWSIDDYTVSPSGDNVAYVVRPPSSNMTWSTNVDIYLTPTDKGGRPRLLTAKIDGMASSPAFSWDGQRLAWLQMETPGYESDINHIFIHNIATRETVAVAYDWDLSPHSLVWSKDNKHLYTTANSKGRNLMFAVDGTTGKRRQLTSCGSATSIRPVDERHVLYLYSNTDKPIDIHLLNTDSGVSRQLTNSNKAKLKTTQLSKAEDFWFTGAKGDKVHGWMVRPFGFDRQKRYPVALLIHGGPQQASTQGFSHSLWNPNMYASAGFVTLVINFHGSSGYGQNFTNSIRHKWGDYPYVDLMRGIDYITSRLNFVDKSRMVAMGGSYGGYMANWLNGHTDRFRCLVAHDGKFNTISGYYGTDELWFPEWDLGKPWEPAGRAILEENNPERFAASFKTPTLFIQGERDFRIPATESLGAWAMMRRRGIPARLVYFPDEGHWIEKPGNSIRWYTEVLDWITMWTNTTAPYRIR